MLQEQMCRDITTTLHKSMAKSFLSEFASRLKVDIQGDGPLNRQTGDQPSNQPDPGTGISQGGPNEQSQMQINQSMATRQEPTAIQEQSVSNVTKSQIGGAGPPLEKQPTQKTDLASLQASQKMQGIGAQSVIIQKAEKDPNARPDLNDFATDDPVAFAKQIKALSVTTQSDELMRKRQRHGQLRVGDVICLSYQEEVRYSELEQERRQKALDAAEAIDLEQAGKKKTRTLRSLAAPDFHYKGLLYSDGVTDQGVKVIAQHNDMSQNATNLFKQCLFRIEIKQNCEINNKVKELKVLRAEVKETLDLATNKTVNQKTGVVADNSNMSQKMLQDLKQELQAIDDDIERTLRSKQEQDDNNVYEQSLQVGNKITYGQPLQFKHLFSEKYLTMNMHVMSQEYGCCQMFLSETTEHSWFSIEPTFSGTSSGGVINFKDFFHIKSLQSTTPFYYHIFRKPSDEFTTEKSFFLNASQEPTPMKAKLFMTHMNHAREKQFIQSGDVVRLKHLEADGYVTVSSVQIEEILPPAPDFLKGQIRRMNRNEKVELPKGGKDRASLNTQEKADRKSDDQAPFEQVIVNDEYVKVLKGRNLEAVYIEHNHDRLQFTSSCWEIQRVNTFKGGDLILDEVYRLRHVGSGKYLAVADDKQEVVLKNSSNSLNTLFVLKSEMQTKTNVRFGHSEADGHSHVDNHRLLCSKQRIMIMSYMEQKYLQLFEDMEGQGLVQFEHWVNHINDPFLNKNDSASSQLRIINHTFQNKNKQKMIFSIEEVPAPRTIYAYKAGCIFDELLEFYAFMNVWAVQTVPNVDEATETFHLDNERAMDLSDELFDKCQKVMYILNNIESLLKSVDNDDGKLEKCKNELVEQGILDMILRNLEMVYYKTTPPPMFTSAFKVPKRSGLEGEALGGDENYSPATFKIEIYVAQEIAREQLKDVALKMLDLVLTLIRAHRNNSERATKYFPVLFQHFHVHERYIDLSIMNPGFHSEASPEFISMIGEIFRRAQKNSVFIFQDRASNALVEYHKKFTKTALDKEISKMMKKKPRAAADVRPQQLAIDSQIAIENIERSNDTNQVTKWLNLLEPVKFIDQQDQNIEKQITYMNVISMFCRNKEGEGVYPYQMQVTETIFEKELVPLKFGTAKVGNILRPFVYFVRPKATMSSGQFLDQNPLLGELNDTFKMQQKNTHNNYELIFDMHELTRNYETKGKETWPYIDYIVGVINLYAHMCLSGNQTAIKQIKEIGIDESHILCCISPDNERLEIHEKLKYIYMFLTRTMYVENDPIAPGISSKNRCYVWDRLAKNEGKAFADDEEMFAENSVDENLIENDFYAGKANKRKAQMDDPNNSMVVLRHEQEAKDLALIRMIKNAAIWFLQAGPQGTDQFFYHHQSRQFLRSNLKIKIKSLKIYLDVLYALVAEDCVDALFIENASFICQCAMLGSKRMDPEAEQRFPPLMKATWVYILMWLCKDIILRTLDNRQMKNAVRAIEMKVLAILDKICDYRLNLQVHKFLIMFRKFQEQNLDPHVSNERALQLQQQFQDLFNFHQFNNAPSKSDIFLYQRIAEDRQLLEGLERLPSTKCIFESGNFEPTPGTDEGLMNKKIPFDLFLLGYIFTNESSAEVKNKALRVLIKNFSQRDLVVKELARTDLIVTSDDYAVYLSFVAKQRQLRQLINKLVQDEMFHMVYNKSPGNETRNTKNDIINILDGLAQELLRADMIQLRKLQNMIRHINLINDVVNVLLKRLIFKEIFYKDLFQTVIDFLFALCYSNVSCQKFLLPELNFFLDLINHGIETGMLISEVIKCNRDPVYSKDFVRYLINKIFKEGYFKSTLFKQLIRMAEHGTFLGEEQPDNDNEEDLGKNDQLPENSNQQFILKQVIGFPKFRQLLMMKKEYTIKKLGVIKTYAKKKEQYNLSKKEEDASLLQDKERLDLHLAIVDLVAACARNSPFGVAQAQKLIECEELLHSLLTDAVPYLVKKHYFNLLYEVYLRKVPGLDDSNRLSCSDIKFIQIMKWVLLYDLQHSFNFYIGLIIEPSSADSPEVTRKMKQVTREVERAGEGEYDAMNAGKTEKDKDDERRFKAGLSAFAETQPFYVFDTNDKTEFWRYMFEYNKAERSYDGVLCFLERFYRDYHIKDIKDENLQEVTVQIRDRLLAIANMIFLFVEQHEDYIRPMTMDLLKHINKAVQRVPQMRAFRVGKKRVIKDGVAVQLDEEEMQAMLDQSLNVDESRDLDNRMCGEKVLRILRDYIIKENKHIKEALNFKGITTDCLVDRDQLKDTIKGITGGECSYDEIMKALDHFHGVSLEKKQERQVMNVEPGQEGYIMNRNEAAADIVKEIKSNQINFKDVEVQIKDVLKKQNYKAPNQARERGGKEDEPFMPNISERDLSIAINMDLKLFTQRFFEFVHVTKNVSEIHDFVHQLMSSDMINDRTAKIQLVRNLSSCFDGLEGSDEELILISILQIILARLQPQDEDAIERTDSERKKAILRKRNLHVKTQLREWQEVMFEAAIPELLFKFIDIKGDQFLANRALTLLNGIMSGAGEKQQQRILDILKKDDQFFPVFYYIKQRLGVSRTYLLMKIKMGARAKFIKGRMQGKPVEQGLETFGSEFKKQKIYMSQKFDLEARYDELQTNWQQDEINVLLLFLNQLCEGCFRESQLYLSKQVDDASEDFRDRKQGVITSVDLIYEVVIQFICIVDDLGAYVYSDFRTYKLIPLILDTMVEFIYGPCLPNQVFLGKWKKLFSVINSLMCIDEAGNYAGIHQEAKAQLKILSVCTNILLAIVDIKDPAEAAKIHPIILQEINIMNLRQKMVDIYLFKIGGSPEKKRIYEFNLMCTHYKDKVKEGASHCLENEYCQYGHMIPRDKETIQTGFNIFQILSILRSSCPDHPSLQCLNRDLRKYNFLWKDYDTYYQDIFQETAGSDMALPTFQRFERFNATEKRLLDQLVIKCFPETYLQYLEDKTNKTTGKRSALLEQVIKMSKEQKTVDDQAKLLEKVQAKIQHAIDIQDQADEDDEELALLAADYSRDADEELKELVVKMTKEKKLIELATAEAKVEEAKIQAMREGVRAERDKPQKAEKEAALQAAILKWKEKAKGKRGGPSKGVMEQLTDMFKACCAKPEKKADAKVVPFEKLSKEEKIVETKMRRHEFAEKQRLFKYYLASNFYEDNVATVEIAQRTATGTSLITASFMMPAFTKQLTERTRDAIPELALQVSQQEKLEAFQGSIPQLKDEMKWQQKLGQTSPTLKRFANSWLELSYCNLTIILIVNALFVSTLEFDELGQVEFGSGSQRAFVQLVSTVQTAIAIVVMVSYYLEYRSTFLFRMAAVDSAGTTEIQDYGRGKGSNAYGRRMSQQYDLNAETADIFKKFEKYARGSKIASALAATVQEIYFFVRAIRLDKPHLLNVLYVVASIGSLKNDLLNAVLLLDIVKKNPQLSQIFDIFYEQGKQLGVTLALCLVVLHIFAFYAFLSFNEDFEHAAGPDDDDGPDFNMYCRSLGECLASTANVGLRAGGGLGEALGQATRDSPKFVTRYLFDVAFFLIVNIILLNFLSGIIIDSFADKRALVAEQKAEIEGRCFICGLSKSTFDIENIPWKLHIYCQHNLHSYLAFILYVQDKPMNECTGVEKFVKTRVREGQVDFYPLFRCLAIRGGEEVAA